MDSDQLLYKAKTKTRQERTNQPPSTEDGEMEIER